MTKAATIDILISSNYKKSFFHIRGFLSDGDVGACKIRADYLLSLSFDPSLPRRMGLHVQQLGNGVKTIVRFLVEIYHLGWVGVKNFYYIA